MMARHDEAERYRKATQMTLDQLDWCVEYLRSLRKTRISKQLAKNRSAIAARLAAREEDRPARRAAREEDRPARLAAREWDRPTRASR